MSKRGDEIREFIADYLKRNTFTDVCDAVFHDAYHARFGGKRVWMSRGASPVPSAQRWLSRMYREGLLNRFPVGLGQNYDVGFPRWVYGYELKREAVTE